MPKSVDWIPMIPRALNALRETTIAVVDRSTLERLLRVHRRTAIRLLHQFGARQLGNSLLIGREQLVRELETYFPPDRSELPLRTPSQIRRLHGEAETHHFANVRNAERRTVESLPNAIQIAPGHLTVEASDLRDLCAQLWVLLETCKDDWVSVERKLKGLL